jgi:hypothetical protein
MTDCFALFSLFFLQFCLLIEQSLDFVNFKFSFVGIHVLVHTSRTAVAAHCTASETVVFRQLIMTCKIMTCKNSTSAELTALWPWCRNYANVCNPEVKGVLDQK